MDEIKNAYLHLQILADISVKWALETDFLRASLRNEIAFRSGKSAEEVQTECETISFQIRNMG